MTYDRSKSKHECAVPGCGLTIPIYLLMCGSHWRMVPAEIQRKVHYHYRRGGAEEYLAAREAAIKSVEEALS